jgi:hypothetical protein
VFVGGYFYDPFYGPYPWWSRTGYPFAYYPVYDTHATVRVLATPKDAAVYVDGFYAGTVHDFNDWWQGLPLPPGGHEIVLFLEGYRTTRDRLYAAPGSTMKLRRDLEPLPRGVSSERPVLAPVVPAPPPGTFRPPVTPPPPLPPPPAMQQTVPNGALSLRVEPADAEVRIDGEKWVSSDGKQFIVQLAAGRHRIEVAAPGYRAYVAEIQIGDGETTPLNVALTRVDR